MLFGIFLLTSLMQFCYVHGKAPAENCRDGVFNVSSAELEGCDEKICNLKRGGTYIFKFSATVEEDVESKVSLIRKFFQYKDGNAPQVSTDEDVLSSIELTDDDDDSSSKGNLLSITSQVYPLSKAGLEVSYFDVTTGEQKNIKLGPLFGDILDTPVDAPVDPPKSLLKRDVESVSPVDSETEIIYRLDIKSPLAGNTKAKPAEATLPLKKGQKYDFKYNFTVPDGTWKFANWLDLLLKGDDSTMFCVKYPVTVSDA